MFKILALIYIFDFFNGVKSSHFYGGSISSKPIKDIGNNVVFNFTIRFAYRSSYSSNVFCDSNTIANHNLIGPDYKIYCVIGCKKFSEIVGSTKVHCISYSEANDWSFGSRSFSYTIPKTSDYEIVFEGGDWGDLVVYGYNSTGASWEIRHKIDSRNQTSSKTINSSPITLMPPLITVPINNFYVLDIPSADDDGDEIKCRWADWSKKECQDVCMAVPFAYLDEIKCKLYLNTSIAEIGMYAAAIQVEDFRNHSSIPISSVPLQFLISIVEETTCKETPNLFYEYPKDSCIASDESFQIEFFAKSPCNGVNISEIVIIGPPDSLILEMNHTSDLVSRAIVFNHTEPGQHLVCAKAIDIDSKSSNNTCFKVLIGSPIPNLIKTTTYPTENITRTSEKINFTAEFNVEVKKSNTTGLIRVFSSKSKDQVYTISSNDVHFYTNSTKIMFQIDLKNFDIGDYFILFDYGVAVSEQFCNPISNKISDEFFWEFSLVEDESKEFSLNGYEITTIKELSTSTTDRTFTDPLETIFESTISESDKEYISNAEILFTPNTNILNDNYNVIITTTEEISTSTTDRTFTDPLETIFESTISESDKEYISKEITSTKIYFSNEVLNSTILSSVSSELLLTMVSSTSPSIDQKNFNEKTNTTIFSPTSMNSESTITKTTEANKVFSNTSKIIDNSPSISKFEISNKSTFIPVTKINTTKIMQTNTTTKNSATLYYESLNSTFAHNLINMISKKIDVSSLDGDYDIKNDCNNQSLSVVFLVINFCLILMHHLFIWVALRILQKKKNKFLCLK